MDELDQLLATVPAEKRETLRQHWASDSARGVKFQDWAQAVRAKYPAIPEVTPSDATATPRALPTMVGAPVLSQDVQSPRIPLPSAPGPFATGLIHAGNTLLPFADEIAAGLTTGKVSGPEYETARRLAEYRVGSSANANPTAAGIGTGIGAAGLLALPTASPEVLAGRGTGRLIGRGIAEGAGLGAVYGAGASDPGLANRIRGGVIGGVEGGAAGGVLSGLGGLLGATRGTPEGRATLGIAEAGDADIGMAQQRLKEAHPDSPLVAADILGPVGPSRVRAAAAVPGPGQRIVGEVFPARTAGRPERFQNVLETELGAQGNPYQVADEMKSARSQEAEQLFQTAYQAKLPKNDVVKVPRVRELVQRLRSNREAAGLGNVRPNAPITVEELHSVRKILDNQSQALTSPAASSADKEAAFVASGLRDRVDGVLKSIPEFAQADEAFRNASGLMDARELGNTLLQTDPAKVEYEMGRMSPDQVRMMQLGIPTSTSRAIESGSAQSAMGKLGIGPGGRLGRARVLESVLPPNAAKRFSQVAADEQLMIPAERAQNITSPTEPTRQSIGEAALGGLSFGEPGMVRRLLLRSMHGGPNPEALASDARLLTRGGKDLEQLLNEAVEARQGRGEMRLGGVSAARASGTGIPTIQRTEVAQERAQASDQLEQAKEYYQALLSTGATPNRALELTQRRFGL